MKLITNSTYLTFISLLIFSFGCLRNPEDCEGTKDGSAYIDECGGCVGGTTTFDACVDVDGDGFDDRDLNFLQDLKNIMQYSTNVDLFNIGKQEWRGGRLISFAGGNANYSGGIPESIGGLTHIEELNISETNLTGEIPESIGNLEHVNLLALDNNQLTGEIPEGIWNLNNLTSLVLARNQLSGELPDSMPSFPNLSDLWLDYNQLSGNIPQNIGQLISMNSLDLNFNQFTGVIPESMCALQLKWNDSFSFNISNNRLCPPYPPCLKDYVGNQNTTNCE